MKKLLLSSVLVIVGAVVVNAQRIPTNDYLTTSVCVDETNMDKDAGYIVSDEYSLTPGSTGFYLLNLVGAQDGGVTKSYRACQFDIDYPVGLTRLAEDITHSSDYGFTHVYKGVTNPLTHKTSYNHTLAQSYGVIGTRTLRVVIYSSTNQEFLTSGALALLGFTVDNNAAPGIYPIRIYNIIFADSTPVEEGSTIEISKGYTLNSPSNSFYLNVYVDGTGSANLVVNGDAKYGTFVVPGTSTTAIPSGVTAYKCTETSGTAMTLEPETESYFQAGVPYIVHSDNAVNTTINYVLPGKTVEALANGTSTVNSNNGKLVGVLEEQVVTDGYVLQNQNGNTKFYKIRSAGETISANRCYLMSDGSSAAPALDLPAVTGINAVETGAEKGAIYDMSGRRVNNTVKGGVYIQNGKKVIK